MAFDKQKTAWIVLIVVSIIIIIASGLNLWFTRTITQRLAVIDGVDKTVSNFQNILNIGGLIFGIIFLIVGLYNYFAKAGEIYNLVERIAGKETKENLARLFSTSRGKSPVEGMK